MEYTLPTTRDELFETLKEIYDYYRIRRGQPEIIAFSPLVLDRINYTRKTGDEIWALARTYTLAEQEKTKLKYKEEIEDKIASLTEQIDVLQQKSLDLANETERRYRASEEKFTVECNKKGLSNSSILLDKIASLEEEMNAEILEMMSATNDKVSAMQGEITALNNKLTNIDTHFLALFNAQVMEKRQELFEKEDQIVKEVFKYNNTLDEREQRHDCAMEQARITLEIKRAQLGLEELTKEKLVEMGYYEAVLECVYAYYNTLDADDAFVAISHEPQLPVYLDHYYDAVISFYKNRQ